VVDRYRAQGACVMRTDDDGAIEIDAGPTGASIRPYRSATPRGWLFAFRAFMNTGRSINQPVGKEKEH